IDAFLSRNNLQISPSTRRISARIIDCIILSVLYVLLCLLFSSSRMPQALAMDVTLLVMVFIYLPILESTGGTPGKRAMRIKPVSYELDNSGKSPTYGQAFFKSIFIGWPVMFGFVIALMILNHPVEPTFMERMGLYGSAPRTDDYIRKMLGYLQLSNSVQFFLLLVCYASVLVDKHHIGWHDKAGKIVIVKK
ncbi:MAG TPA: RDD family protein, partial [Niabella sp.]|nr:RDD family protein [Niabella sp.]